MTKWIASLAVDGIVPAAVWSRRAQATSSCQGGVCGSCKAWLPTSSTERQHIAKSSIAKGRNGSGRPSEATMPQAWQDLGVVDHDRLVVLLCRFFLFLLRSFILLTLLSSLICLVSSLCALLSSLLSLVFVVVILRLCESVNQSINESVNQ